MEWWRRILGRWRGRPPAAAPDILTILAGFQAQFDLRFRDQPLLRQALTHRSFLGSNGGDPALSNERIEFLGDAVLELTVIEYLYARYPLDREGNLTKKKGLLVSREVLAQCAERMGLGEFILLSDAERDAGGHERSSILSDTFEAVIGAVYLDSGLDEARRFARRYLLVQAGEILEDQSLSNHKSTLQEKVQARFKTHPRYRVVSETGPDHQKVFLVEASIRGRLLGRGGGRNKKEAEQAAAKDALDHLPRDGEPLPDLTGEAPTRGAEARFDATGPVDPADPTASGT